MNTEGAEMKMGTVVFFHPEKQFGFVCESGDLSKKVFFHLNDCARGKGVVPREGDTLTFEVGPGAKGPKASNWGFQQVRLADIPPIGKDDLAQGDLIVHHVNDRGYAGFGARVNWIEVLFRPSTGELFQLHCWDGELGGCAPYGHDYERLDWVNIVE